MKALKLSKARLGLILAYLSHSELRTCLGIGLLHQGWPQHMGELLRTFTSMLTEEEVQEAAANGLTIHHRDIIILRQRNEATFTSD